MLMMGDIGGLLGVVDVGGAAGGGVAKAGWLLEVVLFGA
jgi:hypothetical protein